MKVVVELPERVKARLPVRVPAKVPPGLAVSVAAVPLELVTMPPVPGRLLVESSVLMAWFRPFRSKVPPLTRTD